MLVGSGRELGLDKIRGPYKKNYVKNDLKKNLKEVGMDLKKNS
ncbi:MAG: hypothetical protein OQK82_01775 [Candidatus Pacearchaeota archaeon]|nr:hypothetical protein [Candidatus Pacearchaeota archaeon]